MSDLERFILLVALPTVVVASLVEAAVLTWRGRYDWKGLAASLGNLVLRTVVLVAIPLSLAEPALRWAWDHRIATQSLDSGYGLLLLFVGQDFCYYWYHRASHRVRWFWTAHSVHHSPNDLNLSAAYRISALGKLAGSAIFFLPLVWIGFHPRAVAAAVSLSLLYQFWVHASWMPRLGWLEWVLNTPSAHRVHHARNPEYLDANYGGVLIVFDRLFGTYVRERDDIPCDYGLVHRQTSHNPLRIELEPWRDLVKDLLRARSVRAVLGHLFMPPAWTPQQVQAAGPASNPAARSG